GVAATYTPSSPDSGNISYVKGLTTESITFDGTESLFDEKSADSLSVNAGGANDAINIVNGPISPVTVVDQGGPVIVDGGDRDDHGAFTGGANQDGWKFIEQSVDFLDANACLPGSPCNGTAFTKSVLIIGTTSGKAFNAATSALAAQGLTFDTART